MKMIASTKVTKAQRTMESARVYGDSAVGLFKHIEVSNESKKPLVIVVSSDRGLCGGIHSSVSKAARRYLAQHPEAGLSIIGIKAKAQLQRDFRENLVISFDSVAKILPTWNEAALIAREILKSGEEFDSIQIVFNRFKSVIAFEPIVLPVPGATAVSESQKINSYEVEGPTLQGFQEFTLANALYWAIAEGYASELAARRTAMENATKNAGEMIQKLTLTYNRSRQATITNELIDIITGASAM
ncbi:atp3 gamma subunit of the F1 sector of mitochondrial F1F0 ATP synthase [Borealophlyctis nickersoniae]|nr:atp3 gamma subunit of the F1 sector of mitochondrial F1F0 ATP synthase [Borealophlyctis nickersoniae]